MRPAGMYRCEVCGARQKDNDWFLVTEDRECDTLQILKWNTRLAEQPGMHHLCSAAHVEDFVSQWMVSGSLDYGWTPAADMPASRAAATDTDASYRLGELLLDRASFSALGERPDMLNSILDALDGALQASVGAHSVMEDEDEEEPALAYDA
jgi:hypothetical protein